MNDMTRREFCTAGLAHGITPIAGNLFAQAQPNSSVPTINDLPMRSTFPHADRRNAVEWATNR
ncbi:hypothetical protein ACFL6P_06505 [Candidatus Latescibacterota bacterium]